MMAALRILVGNRLELIREGRNGTKIRDHCRRAPRNDAGPSRKIDKDKTVSGNVSNKLPRVKGGMVEDEIVKNDR
jgi:hypothetical protein